MKDRKLSITLYENRTGEEKEWLEYMPGEWSDIEIRNGFVMVVDGDNKLVQVIPERRIHEINLFKLRE